MKNRFFSLVRTTGAVTLLSAAAAMAFVAVKPPSPSLAAKPDGKATAKLGAKYVRSPAFARHFQTLMGRESSGEASRLDGFAQEMYDDTAYPNTFIGEAQRKAAHDAAKALRDLAPAAPLGPLGPLVASWQARGPNGVNASATVVNESTAGTSPTIFSGRTTAIAVDPNCSAVSCTVFIGAAGGGVWKTTNALAATPTWTQVSDGASGIPSNAIGSIVFDPNDGTGNTLYVGTGEPNGSGDSEAGIGLFKSTDGGITWALVGGSIGTNAPCSQSALTNCPVATGRSIGAIAIDPNDATHIFIGTDVARHGSSSVNGGRFTPPGVAKVGLYESINSGATFVAKVTPAQDTVSPGSSNGGDFFRGGCSHIELHTTTLPETEVYASFFDYGVFRRSMTQDGDVTFHQIFLSGGGGTVAASSVSRTEFSLAPNGGNLRVYVGDADNTGLGTLYRVDNANVLASSLFNGTSNVGWTSLSNSTKGTSGFSSFNYCTGQCTYDMPVYSPPGAPGTVYIGGAMHYEEIFVANRPSNGRAVQRSTDAGVDFTDMTIDSAHNLSLHPDQHAIASTPFNPDIVFIVNDGGVWRLNGSFTDASDQCSSRGLTGADFTDCEMWLRAIPTSTTTLNQGLTTLQFQSVSLNPANPLADWLGGTQDNGTQAFQNNSWFVTIFGDGGQSGTSPFHSNIRFHNFFDASPDVNFNGDSEFGWDVIDGPLFAVEPQSFYIPMIFDPMVDGTMFAGLDFIWRTTDNGGNPTTLQTHCNELTGDFPKGFSCGDWVRIGPGSMPLDATKALGDGTFWGTDKRIAGYVVATRRAPSDNKTLWVGTRRGRVFVSSNVNTAKVSNVSFFRIDETGCPASCTNLRPTRFVSGIDVDPSNPNHAFISYSGYNAYATAAGKATGHIFEVTYDPVSHTATWGADLAGGLGDQPVRAIVKDWSTGDIFASTDFGVFVNHLGTWSMAGTGLPEVAVYGLTFDSVDRVLFAATHGRSIYSLSLP